MAGSFPLWCRRFLPAGDGLGREQGIASHGFLRGLGLIYVLWFWSFAAQAPGLIGPKGLTPYSELLAEWRSARGILAPLLHPTLLWILPGAGTSLLVCAAGALAGLLLLGGVFPFVAAWLAWICQLSLVNAAPDWLQSAGDALLGEAGFLSLFFVSPRWGRVLPGPAEMPRRPAVMLLVHALLFKLMFGSGLAKLASPAWRDGTALFFFFETQPLPTLTGSWLHFLPESVLLHALWGIMFIELALPFYLLLTRTFRDIAAAGFALHALLFLLAGNAGFLPHLQLLLAFCLIDDFTWRRLLPEGSCPAPLKSPSPSGGWALLLLFLPVVLFGPGAPVPWRQLADWLQVVNSCHRYAPNVQVPVRRFEISLQGSRDARIWREYLLRQRPSDPRWLPALAISHHPRLDEQLALAARTPDRLPRWLPRLVEGLRAGQPEILALLGANPFADAPPTLVRLVLYEYRFADPAARRRERVWWVRAPITRLR